MAENLREFILGENDKEKQLSNMLTSYLATPFVIRAQIQKKLNDLGESEYWKQSAANFAEQITPPMNDPQALAEWGMNFSMPINVIGPVKPWFHGTDAPNFTQFKSPNEYGGLSTLLGTHFSRTPSTANKFAKGLGNVSYHEQSRVIPATIHGRLKKVDQTHLWNPKELMWDDTAVAKEIVGTVMPKRRDLFVEWVKKSRNVNDDVANDIFNRLSSGQDVPTKMFGVAGTDMPHPTFGEYIADFDSNLLHLSVPERHKVVELYKDIMKKEGYTGVRYVNTSPSETREIMKPEELKRGGRQAAIVFDYDKMNIGAGYKKPNINLNLQEKLLKDVRRQLPEKEVNFNQYIPNEPPQLDKWTTSFEPHTLPDGKVGMVVYDENNKIIGSYHTTNPYLAKSKALNDWMLEKYYQAKGLPHFLNPKEIKKELPATDTLKEQYLKLDEILHKMGMPPTEPIKSTHELWTTPGGVNIFTTKPRLGKLSPEVHEAIIDLENAGVPYNAIDSMTPQELLDAAKTTKAGYVHEPIKK